MKPVILLFSTSILSFVIYKMFNKRNLDKQFQEMLNELSFDEGELVFDEKSKCEEIIEDMLDFLSSNSSIPSTPTNSLNFTLVDY